MYNILYLGTKPIGEKCFAVLSDGKWDSMRITAVCSHTNYDNYWYQGNSIQV